MSDIIVTTGRQGWGNRKGGCEAYGPLGRWATAQQMPNRANANVVFGDLLGDHLEELGAHEGSPFIVIAFPSRFAVTERDELLAEIEALVARREVTS